MDTREILRCKQGHCYIIRYRKGQEDAAADVLARWARHPDLNLDWTDASALGDDLGAAKGILLGTAAGFVFWVGLFAAVGRTL